MKSIWMTAVIGASLLFTGACSDAKHPSNPSNGQVTITAFRQVEPKAKATDKEILENAKNVCGYVKTKDDWAVAIDTGEFAGLDGGSGQVRINMVDVALKKYCPEVWKSIDK